MKKLLLSLLVCSSLIFGVIKCQAATYEELVAQSKPSAILIYADWIDNVQPTLTAFDAMQPIYGKKFGFAKVNICDKEAKAFNQRNYIYPNLPYIILFKDRGRISRIINRDCILDDACIKERFDFFAN